jgi:ribosomal protein S18 acetylase RimI-like enzyme
MNAAVISRQATDRDLQAMLDTLVPAFADDPVWGGWAFPDNTRAMEQRRALFRSWLIGALEYSEVRVTQNCEAVAVWFPPAGTRSSTNDQRELVEIAHGLLGSHADVFLAGYELLEESHPQEKPHYYLALLGTHNGHRGQGLGMELVRQSLFAIDTARLPAYLESTNPKNLLRYERLGFKRIGSIQLPSAGPRIDRMWRERSSTLDGRA